MTPSKASSHCWVPAGFAQNTSKKVDPGKCLPGCYRPSHLRKKVELIDVIDHDSLDLLEIESLVQLQAIPQKDIADAYGISPSKVARIAAALRKKGMK